MMRRHAPWLVGLLGLLSSCQKKSEIARVEAIAIDAGKRADAGEAVAAASPKPRPDLTFLYTSDLRGRISAETAAAGGLARRATLVDRVKVEGAPVIQLDSGDVLAGFSDGDIPGAAYPPSVRTHIVLASYERLGIDAMTPGERDLELGRDHLKAALRAAEIPVVAANLFGKGDERPFPADELIDVGGQSIGVFGILDMPAQASGDLQRWGFRISDAEQATSAAVQSLRSRGARLVVGLLHVVGGRARAEEILARAGGVDVAILGHAADGGDGDAGAPNMLGHTRVFFAGTLGAAVGRLDVRALRSGAEPEFEGQSILLTSAIPEQIGVAAIERAVLATQREKNGQKEPLVPPNWTYASNDSCAMCHQAETAQWNTTDHAHAFASLTKYKRDRDHECLGCHMTGYLQPGQSTSPVTMNKYFENVGCESCHGPSALHVRSVNKKMGTSRTVGPQVCMGCHTHDQGLGIFDYAAALQAILGPGHQALAANPLPKAHP